jgi:hypothetical protein
MTDRKPADPQENAESLIAHAQAARVKAHIRVMLSRVQSHLKSSSKAVVLL